VRNRKRMEKYRVRTGFRLCSMDQRRSLGCIADQDVANVPGRLRHASRYREGVRTIDARACVCYLTDMKRSGASCSEFEGNTHRKGCESSKMRRPEDKRIWGVSLISNKVKFRIVPSFCQHRICFLLHYSFCSFLTRVRRLQLFPRYGYASTSPNATWPSDRERSGQVGNRAGGSRSRSFFRGYVAV
jgi:hypothetical protein